MEFFKNNGHHITRSLLGVMFVVFGLNGFFNFLPQPPPSNDAAGAFLGALVGSGYFFPMLKGIQVLVGISLLVNRFAPLALIVLAPITVNIVAFHVFLEPAGTGLSIVVAILHIATMWAYRKNYMTALSPKPIL